MTEDQWLICTDPIQMIEFLRGNPTSEDEVTWWNNRWQLDNLSKGDDRKFRLYACVCCRRIWDHIPEACNRDAVEAVEKFLERTLPGSEVLAALIASSAVEWKEDGTGRRTEPGYWVVKDLGRGFYKMTAGASALVVASKVIFMADEEYGRQASEAFHGCYYYNAGVFLSPFHWPVPIPAAAEAERARHGALLRCIFDNRFQRRSIKSMRFTPTVTALSEAAYEERVLPSGELDCARLSVLADALEDAGCNDRPILDHLRGRGPHVRGCWPLDLVLAKE